MSGGFCPGAFCPGILCRGAFDLEPIIRTKKHACVNFDWHVVNRFLFSEQIGQVSKQVFFYFYFFLISNKCVKPCIYQFLHNR